MDLHKIEYESQKEEWRRFFIFLANKRVIDVSIKFDPGKWTLGYSSNSMDMAWWEEVQAQAWRDRYGEGQPVYCPNGRSRSHSTSRGREDHKDKDRRSHSHSRGTTYEVVDRTWLIKAAGEELKEAKIEFEKWIEQHKIKYDSAKEEWRRFFIFLANKRIVDDYNKFYLGRRTVRYSLYTMDRTCEQPQGQAWNWPASRTGSNGVVEPDITEMSRSYRRSCGRYKERDYQRRSGSHSRDRDDGEGCIGRDKGSHAERKYDDRRSLSWKMDPHLSASSPRRSPPSPPSRDAKQIRLI